MPLTRKFNEYHLKLSLLVAPVIPYDIYTKIYKKKNRGKTIEIHILVGLKANIISVVSR